jgi:hypothetical protein
MSQNVNNSASTKIDVIELVLTVSCRAGEFERWLAASDAAADATAARATDLYTDYRLWSAVVERCAKQRKFVARCIAKYPLLARLGLGRLYDRLAPLCFRIQRGPAQ